MLPPPPPFEGPARCPLCVGARVMPDRYRFGQPAPRLLMVQAFCPLCLGCGRASHEQCQPTDHCHDDDEGEDRDHDLDVDDLGPGCGFCQSRGWWVAQAFSDTSIIYLRVPCGCAEKLMERVQ